jgi:hypothetical protein
LLKERPFGEEVTMVANHTAQREGERRGAVEEAPSRREEKKQAWFNRVVVGLLVGFGMFVIALPIAFIVQWVTVPIVPTVVFLVGMMALIAALHFLQRGSERYGLGGTISSVASFVGFALIAVGALIGAVSQNWALGGPVMVAGLWAATIGLAALAIFTLNAGVVPWWGGAALIAGNPLLDSIAGEIWSFWLVPVPMLVVGFAVVLAARRRTERPARVR